MTRIEKKKKLFNTARTKIVTARRKNYRNHEPVTLAPVPHRQVTNLEGTNLQMTSHHSQK